jgi:hypothetical protein
MNMNQFNIALETAIKTAGIPFNLYDASFFGGEGKLEGDWTVMAESTESEYAIVIEKVQLPRTVKTIAGDRVEMCDHYKIFYPFFDKGDPSVGLDDAWIIDFEYDEADYVTDSITDAARHAVNWFMNNEMRWAIDNALEAEYWQREREINPRGYDY